MAKYPTRQNQREARGKILEKHSAPRNGRVFKFASAYSEAMADLATNGKAELQIRFMRAG